MAKDYIFTSGKCQKQDLYKVIKNAFLTAGWKNVASDIADFDVLQSAGETGDKKLLIQMRPTNSANGNSIENTDYAYFSLRLIGDYIPGDVGKAGTTSRSALAWTDVYVAPVASLAKDTVVNYDMYVDKSKLIMCLTYPPSTNFNPIVMYIGLPDSLYCDEPDSRGVIFAHSYAGNGANNVTVTNNAGGLTSLNAPDSRPCTCSLSPKNPNANGNYVMSEIFYGNTIEGIRGKLDGIYAMPNQNLLTGDILTIDTMKFKVAITHANITAFPSVALAYRIV